MTQAQQLPLFTTGISRRSRLIDLVEPFQHYLRDEGKTQNTITGFTSDLHLMCEFFGDEAPIGRFTTTDLQKFMDWLETGRGKPCSRKSYARRVTTLKVFFKWLKEIKVRPDNPAEAPLQRSGPAPLQPVLSHAEISTLLDYTFSLRFKEEKADARPDLLVRLVLETGIKKSEAMSLTLQHIDRRDPANPMIVVRYKQKKNIYKERRIPIMHDWLDVLEEFIEQYNIKDTLFNCTPRNLEYVLRDAEIAAGVETKVSFEVLRWTCAVRDYLNGMDMDALREKMGLSRISWRETGQKIETLAKQQIKSQNATK